MVSGGSGSMLFWRVTSGSVAQRRHTHLRHVGQADVAGAQHPAGRQAEAAFTKVQPLGADIGARAGRDLGRIECGQRGPLGLTARRIGLAPNSRFDPLAMRSSLAESDSSSSRPRSAASAAA